MYVFICKQYIVDFEIYKWYFNCVTSFLKLISSHDDERNAREQAQLHKRLKCFAHCLTISLGLARASYTAKTTSIAQGKIHRFTGRKYTTMWHRA